MTKTSRWLSPEERGAWIGLMAVASRLPGVLDNEMKASTGLNHFEYVVLARLSEVPDHTVQLKHLALLTNGSLSRLSHVVSRLEERGWLTRRAIAEDGRLTVAVLTDAGHAKVVASAPHHLDAVRRHVIDVLSPTQVRQLGAVTRPLVRGLYPEAGRDGPSIP